MLVSHFEAQEIDRLVLYHRQHFDEARFPRIITITVFKGFFCGAMNYIRKENREEVHTKTLFECQPRKLLLFVCKENARKLLFNNGISE